MEWSVTHGGRPHALCYVDDDPPRLWVTDTERDQILFLEPGNGEAIQRHPEEDEEEEDPEAFLCTFECEGKRLLKPRGLTLWEDVGEEGSSEVWVADSGNNRLVAFDPVKGGATRSMNGSGLLSVPVDVVAMDSHRLASVCRRGGHIFSPQGELLARFNWHLMVPTAVVFDDRGADGLILTADEYTQRISMFHGSTGVHLRTISETGLCEGSFAYKGFAMNETKTGAKRLLIADSGNRRIAAIAATFEAP